MTHGKTFDAGHSYDGAKREAEARKCATAVSKMPEMTPAGGKTSYNDDTCNNHSDKDPKGNLGG